MAIVKHIKSRNANYSAAINYLLFEHDEKTGKKIVDDSGRSILRKEFYMDGLGIDHDSAGYVTPQGLRNVLIISATPYQWKHMIS